MPLNTAMEFTMRCRATMAIKNAIEYGDGSDDAMQREYDACPCRRTAREVERESGTDGTHRGTRNTEDEQLAR